MAMVPFAVQSCIRHVHLPREIFVGVGGVQCAHHGQRLHAPCACLFLGPRRTGSEHSEEARSECTLFCSSCVGGVKPNASFHTL